MKVFYSRLSYLKKEMKQFDFPRRDLRAKAN